MSARISKVKRPLSPYAQKSMHTRERPGDGSPSPNDRADSFGQSAWAKTIYKQPRSIYVVLRDFTCGTYFCWCCPGFWSLAERWVPF
jgi:hypothetical protein